MRTDIDENSGSDLEVLEAEISAARDRLYQQQETLREFSREGMRMFRLLLLSVAAPAAILGALSPNTLIALGDTLFSASCAIGGPSSCLIPMWSVSITTGGLFLLGAGVNIAAAGLENRGIHSAPNPEDVLQTVEMDPSLSIYLRDRLTDIAHRIDHNNRIISALESLLALGKVFLSLGTFGAASLAFLLISESPIPGLLWFFAFVLFYAPLIIYGSQLPEEYLEADRLLKGIPLYDRGKVQNHLDDNLDLADKESSKGKSDDM